MRRVEVSTADMIDLLELEIAFHRDELEAGTALCAAVTRQALAEAETQLAGLVRP